MRDNRSACRRFGKLPYRYFILTLLPHINGHRSGVVQIEKLVNYMKSKPGVWFPTFEQVATYVKPSTATAR